MASLLRKRERVANILLAQIAPNNNCHIVGGNLKTEHNVENTVAVAKRTDRVSGSGSANKNHSLFYAL